MDQTRQPFPDPERRPGPHPLKSELLLELALLRQQLIIRQRQTKRPKITWRDRSLIVLLASKLRTWKQALIIVQPDTVLRWHCELFKRFWKRKSKPNPKQIRPPLKDNLVALIKRVVKENLTWGAERIRGELLKLGISVSKSSIQKYMKGVRECHSSKQTWATFLRNHANQIWACDFLQTYDVFFRTVFVIIELGSRRVVHFGVTRDPTDQWTAQQLREATPFGEKPRFLIRDNDDKFGPSFARVAAEIEMLKTPYRTPKANAICEHFIGSLRRECLDHFLILGDRHLYRLVKEYKTYFNHARPHQGIGERWARNIPALGLPSLTFCQFAPSGTGKNNLALVFFFRLDRLCAPDVGLSGASFRSHLPKSLLNRPPTV